VRLRARDSTGAMLKIWSMKQAQQKEETAQGPAKKKKVTAAQLRVQKGMHPSITPDILRCTDHSPC